jgi:predicted RNA binding protein YcfA (HicA-like mRNA interferase family)
VGIDYSRLRNVTAREIISALNRDGFTWDRGGGSHQVYCHADGRRVTVIFHAGSDTFRRKTLKSMIEQTCWTEDDLRRLKLIR